MNHQTTTQDILNDIEFEIAQGMLSREEFGPAIEAVRQFQNRLRSQTNKSIKLNDPNRQIINRQFQTIDMLLALLQEMALRIQALQAALARIGSGKEIPAESQTTTLPAAEPYPLEPSTASSAAHHPSRAHLDRTEILHAMRPETVSVPLQARSIHIPLIGGLLTRLRIFYQRPALHYTALLSERQAPVNRLLGEQIIHLQDQIEAQQQQIDALRSQLETHSPRPNDAALS